MGHLQAFNVQEMINKFNIQGYIETGTGIGDSLSYALKFSFKKLYSIEYDTKLYNKAIKKFIDPRLKIINNFSKHALPEIFSEINENDPYLFFLDAHFPEADFGIASNRYQISLDKYGSDALPLETELNIIDIMRPLHQDVILIDDVWIYEEGPFEMGNWSERNKLNTGNMTFVSEILENTHNILKIYKQQGYLILTPKESKK
ncbi:hypothetical protein DRQ07_07435 [candidate division KSB1 bacterium]|nr:MAG: hypothetical protein DRQ07_07435 [candidate division KSB1 bacterium]